MIRYMDKYMEHASFIRYNTIDFIPTSYKIIEYRIYFILLEFNTEIKINELLAKPRQSNYNPIYQ